MDDVTNPLRVNQRAALRAVGAATQWRLLLLWIGLLLLPTAIIALPMWRALAAMLDHSVHAQAWANAFNALAAGDTIAALAPASAALGGAALLSVILMLLLSPFLNGMAVGSALADRRLGFGHLLQCGVVEYPRMFRLMLWSLPLYAVLFVAGGALTAFAGKIGDRAVLESVANTASSWGVGGMLVLLLLGQLVMDAARGAFMADPALRSATRAFGRGWLVLLRRPLSALGWFLGVSVIGFALAAAFSVLRVTMDGGGVIALLLGIALTQCIALAIVWAHIARMFALRAVARSLPARRSRAVPPPMVPAVG